MQQSISQSSKSLYFPLTGSKQLLSGETPKNQIFFSGPLNSLQLKTDSVLSLAKI